MTIIQRLEDIINEIDDIKHPPTEITTISELEEKLMEYEGEPICITHPMYTEDLSDYKHLTYMGTGHNPRRKVYSIQWNHGESRVVTRNTY